MDRKQLKKWLDEGLSLPQIGALAGQAPGTVGYWVKKYGLVANGSAEFSPKGGLTYEQLEPLVDAGTTLEDIAAELDVATSTVRYWLGKHGLRTRLSYHRRRKLALEALEEGTKRFQFGCPTHGVTAFVVYNDGRSRCAKCNADGVLDRRRRVKMLLIEEAGGECVICGMTVTRRLSSSIISILGSRSSGSAAAG